MFGNLGLALQITVIGMGIVFAAIVLLWGIIALLVRATTDAPSTEPEETPAAAVSLPADSQLRRRAAAVAVAVAMAQEGQPKTDFSPLPPHPISPWQAMLRGRQIEQLERRGRTR